MFRMADVTVELGKPRPRTAVAKKFAELVTEKGKSPAEAADLMGIKIDSAGASQLRREVEGVIRGYTMKPEAAKVLVRAARNKLLIDALGTDGHEYDPKIALEAATNCLRPGCGFNRGSRTCNSVAVRQYRRTAYANRRKGCYCGRKTR